MLQLALTVNCFEVGHGGESISRLCGSIETHDLERRDRPADRLAPFVESMRFYEARRAPGLGRALPAERRPGGSPPPRAFSLCDH